MTGQVRAFSYFCFSPDTGQVLGSLICEMCNFAVHFKILVQAASLCVNKETLFPFKVQDVEFGLIYAFYWVKTSHESQKSITKVYAHTIIKVIFLLFKGF